MATKGPAGTASRGRKEATRVVTGKRTATGAKGHAKDIAPSRPRSVRVVRRHLSPERRVANMFRRWYRGLVAYFRETRLEMRKVVWPSRRETAIYTLVVVIATAVVAMVVWVFDVGLSAILGRIIR